MSATQHLIANFWFQLFTWLIICSALISNIMAVFCAIKDQLLGGSHKWAFIPIVAVFSFYFCCDTLYFFDVFTRPEYLDLISPMAPVAYFVVGTAPALGYIFSSKNRKIK